MSDSANHLLYVISAHRVLSWASFKEAYDVLFLRAPEKILAREKIEWHRRRVMRALDVLGHCDVDFSDGSGKIYIAPPVLARLPTGGLPQAILCGIRTPQSLSHLLQVCQKSETAPQVTVTGQDGGTFYVPKRILIRAETSDVLDEVATMMKIEYSETPPAWGLLEFAAGLDPFLQRCDWVVRPELSWQRRDFNPVTLRFDELSNDSELVRLSSYDDPIRGIRIHYLWEGARCARVDLDWGRYAFLYHRRLQVLMYNPRKLIMAVPASTPLPRLYGRALVLSSGYAPKYVERAQITLDHSIQTSFDIYHQVPHDIASLVATKLGQKLTENTTLSLV